VTDIGNRHRGTAGGALFMGGRPVSVEIRLGEDASETAVQHTAWTLLNILCRLEGAVSKLRVHCPEAVRAVPRLSPLIPDGQTLRGALLAGARSIGTPADGVVPAELASTPGQSSEIVIGVGFCLLKEATFCAIGNGLCGGVFTRPITEPVAFSNLTIGPYIAACLAAGEVFRQVRLIDYTPERQLFLTASDYSHSDHPSWTDLATNQEFPSILLAGVGAVGSAFLHALYPLPIAGTLQLADNDEEGIDGTNLGRYALFGMRSIGKRKASEAASLLTQARFLVVPHDGSFEYFFSSGQRPDIIVSAVDTNEARQALQEQYTPLIFSASTHNLRAEILRCGPPGMGACLSCFNPLKQNQRSEDDIRELLRAKPELISHLCEKLRLNQDEVVMWIRDRKCNETGDRLVDELRTDDGAAPAFAVGFVSVLAGTMLAAELLKTMANDAGPLNGTTNRAVFQFQNPAATTNRVGFYPREECCYACVGGHAGTRVWKRRYEQFQQSRIGPTSVSSPYGGNNYG
jgi:hypothetical protein